MRGLFVIDDALPKDVRLKSRDQLGGRAETLLKEHRKDWLQFLAPSDHADEAERRTVIDASRRHADQLGNDGQTWPEQTILYAAHYGKH